LFDGVLAIAEKNLFAHVALLNALDLRLRGAEIVVTGAGEAAQKLTDAALAVPFTDRMVLRAPSADMLPNHHPAREKIKAVSGTAAFVCVGETCSLPVTAPDEIRTAVESMQT